jgi:uncharacterized membrane protein
LIFFIWVLLQFLAPIFLPENSVEDLSGLVALSDNENTINNMSFPWNSIYSAGDRLCHQKAERSFFVNGNQMPFCSRCTAIWLGLALGLLFMIFYTIQLDGKFLFIALLCVFPMGLDGVSQLIGLWESTNLIRFITGLLTGFICGVAIGVIIDELKGTNVLKK